ncbi:hypothetical protein GBAR_LOCUS4363 [Geodia barretti]|uniref:Uncharacterized protein n=1 Tax=Geodia barretti TaxID=519541 RepID=A0AA35R8A7_GEOBA|nr:hypothetical protein GBAR_LOCUS4363 [Geodia barretti]
MDIQIVAQNGDAYYEIPSRHKIILDLTSCGPSRPLDLSTAPPPTIEFTEPTIPSTTDSSYDTCAALQSISIADGTLCNTNQAYTALECEILRLEIQVDQCHNPPGIIITLYNSQNQPVFNQSYYNESTFVNDSVLPVDLNVTVEQLPPNAIIVEVSAIIRLRIPLPFPNQIPLVPRTVIPIDKSTCVTSAPPTTAPTPTCSAMQHIQQELSSVTVNPCIFPDDHNCSTLTCPGIGDEFTISVLRCAHPPAVRIIYHHTIGTILDHTFNHSEVARIPGTTSLAFNVTLDQLCPIAIGLQVDVTSDFGSSTLIPYTVIPINTTGCGGQDSDLSHHSANHCQSLLYIVPIDSNSIATISHRNWVPNYCDSTHWFNHNPTPLT